MSQNDFNVENQGFPGTRADINANLAALATLSSGATQPSTMFPHQFWFDTGTNELKIRNADNNAWIIVVAFDQSDDSVSSLTTKSLTAQGGAIKLDGNHPLGSKNFAAGLDALDSAQSGASRNTGIGDHALSALTNGDDCTAVGVQAGSLLTTGSKISFFGSGAGQNQSGDGNTMFGYNAGHGVAGSSSGKNNTCMGREAGAGLTTGINNVLIGKGAGDVITTSSENVGVGADALGRLISGTGNTGVGFEALIDCTTGAMCSALGHRALESNTTGSHNTAMGASALASNTTGINNSMYGSGAGLMITVGQQNVGLGTNALGNAISGHNSTAVGMSAASSVTTNSNLTAIGSQALKEATGGGCTAIGYNAGSAVTSAQNSVYIGGFDGNSGNFDARTLDDHVFVSDGSGNLRFLIKDSGDASLGTTVTSLFNSEGTTARFTAAGSDTSTTTTGNGGAAIQIVQTDGTAGNTAGLHFSRQDTDGSPNYSGAAIVAQFPDAQVTGQYPKGLLAFNTSSSANSAPTEKMRLDSSGQLRVNTNAPFNATTGITPVIHVDVNARSSGFHGGLAVGGIASSEIAFATIPGSSVDYFAALFHNSSASGVGSIFVGASSTAYNTTSDYRVKENVNPMTGATEIVMRLGVKAFNFISEPGKIVYGFLAHEAQDVLPQAVTGEHDQVKVWTQKQIDNGDAPHGTSAGDNVLDQNGDTIPVLQGMDHSKMVPVLTAALQEAIGRINALEEEVAALKKKQGE